VKRQRNCQRTRHQNGVMLMVRDLECCRTTASQGTRYLVLLASKFLVEQSKKKKKSKVVPVTDRGGL
jgi:hypothetical protein